MDGLVAAAGADHDGSVSQKESVTLECKPDPRVGFDKFISLSLSSPQHPRNSPCLKVSRSFIHSWSVAGICACDHPQIRYSYGGLQGRFRKSGFLQKILARAEQTAP